MLIQFNYLGPKTLLSPSYLINSTGDIDIADQQCQQLAYFLGIKPEELTVKLIERYNEVTLEKDYQAITPGHQKIRERIVEPLRIAKKSYCFEEYISSIALSGIVGETMAHVFLQLYKTEINGLVIDSSLEKSIFGKNFDELGQMRRIEILSKLRYINPNQKTMLNNLQETRRPYMHWWDLGKTEDEIKNESRKAIIEATKLFSSVFDIKFTSPTSISVDGRVQTFLNKIAESI